MSIKSKPSEASMNNKKTLIEIMVVLSFAVESVAIGLFVQQQHQAYAISQDNIQTQTLIIPGSNADDEPTTLTFPDKGHCHQYIQDHPGLAVDKKDCT